MPKFNPPENFILSNPSEWTDCKQRFARFRIATKLHKEDGEIQISSLIFSLGREAEHIFRTFAFNERDEKVYDKVLEKFDGYFVAKRNQIHKRAKFHQRCQKLGESVETFVRSLHEIAENCECSDDNEQIRDRLVIGISDRTCQRNYNLEQI
jgi:hypothetical protein